MKVNSNPFYLFFCTSIEDHDYIRPPSSFFERIENIGNDCLAYSQYWFKGKKIRVWSNKISLIPFHEPQSTLEKIESIDKAILYFIPGLFLKALVWILDFSYVQKRTQHLFAILKKEATFTQKVNLPKFIYSKKFNQLASQQNFGLFCLLPQDLNNQIVSFLEKKETVNFAHASTKTYQEIASLSSTLPFQCKFYPNLIINALGKKAFSNLPVSSLPKEWQFSFEETPDLMDILKDENMAIKDFQDLRSVLLKDPFSEKPLSEEQLSALMGNTPIQKIEVWGNPGLIIRVKDSLLNQKQTFVIAKIKEKWIVVSPSLSQGMWLFLNDIYFYEKNSPKVEDYLKRLFNGEPCGNFPINLNGNLSIDYQTTKAADTFHEGPRLCPDGITPVIQLA